MGKESVEYTPFKCPDCKVWWRTATHKCDSLSYTVSPGTTTTTNPYKIKARTEVEPRPGWISCPRCGKNISKYDWHTCVNDWHKKKKGKDDWDNPPKRHS